MKKMLYLSPFRPARSGISDYSEILLGELGAYYDITLLTDSYDLENPRLSEKFNVVKYTDGVEFDAFDEIIYNFGNSPYHEYMYDYAIKYPGYVILHDLSLYHLVSRHYADNWLPMLYALEGARGFSLNREESKNPEIPPEILVSKLKMNAEIIRSAKCILVNSLYAGSWINRHFPGVVTKKINLIYNVPQDFDGPSFEGDYLRQAYGLSDDDFIIGSFGNVHPVKRLCYCCDAVDAYNAHHEKKVHYFIVGEGGYADDRQNDYIHKTGYVTMEEFLRSYMSCDMVLNLRSFESYNGECSGTVLSSMQFGKPCVVNDFGWFGELPDDAVIKIDRQAPAEDLASVIAARVENPDDSLGKRAMAFAKGQCSPESVSKSIRDIIG